MVTKEDLLQLSERDARTAIKDLTGKLEDTTKPLTEKYRPTTFQGFVGQKKVKRKLQKLVRRGNIPHLLFTGPSGIGKTTMAYILTHKFNWDINEYNASTIRGVDQVKKGGIIFEAMRHQGITSKNKILLLDEAEQLTYDAQQGLRRPLERFSQTTKVIFSCNDMSKFISAIKDRCLIFKFTKISVSDIVRRLKYITMREDIPVNGELREIAKESNGSMRKAIILLSSYS